MTNKNKKRREGYRTPSEATDVAESARPAPRAGLLTSMFSARGTGTTNMPRVRTTFVRGLTLVLSTPVLLASVVAGVFLAWLGALAAGFQGPASLMSSVAAMPPIGTLFDLQLVQVFGGADTGTLLLGLIPFAVVRAVVTGVIVGVSVEVLETGRSTTAGVRRGVLVAPMVLIVTIIEIGFLFVANILGQVVGQGLGLFVQVGAIAGAIYLLAYAPVAQLREGRGVLESLSRSSLAARIPASSSLAMALLYAVPSLFLQTPVGGFDVNPSPQVWLFVLFVNVLHVAMIATYAYRWMCIEDEVPDAPARRPRGRSR
jgi:hypothetical protein